MEKHVLIIFICILSVTYVNGFYPAIDQSIYDNALDEDLCDQQLQEIFSNATLAFAFLDTGIRLPRGILKGNLVDYGNYHQCLEINQELSNSTVEGKYCSISIAPTQSNIEALNRNNIDLSGFETFKNSKESTNVIESLKLLEQIKNIAKLVNGELLIDDTTTNRAVVESVAQLSLNVAFCLPKVCSTTQVFEYLLNTTTFNASESLFTENYCRLPNDKPWAPVDYVAVSLLSFIGLLTILSTSYDILKTFGPKTDSKQINKIYTLFSVYTNTRRLVTYNSNPRTIECLDGIRVIAMAWVIVGHRFILELRRPVVNLLDAIQWSVSWKAVWLTSAPISVDTFFVMSGLLLVYTTVGRMTNMKLVKGLHLFYLHRIMRMFPMLALAVLIQASIANRVVDGPNWTNTASAVEACRQNWWATLLYVQNFFSTSENITPCVAQSWYLAVDMQLHLLSPLILFWVLTGRKAAWISMVGGLLIFTVGTTIYVFIMAFPSNIIGAGVNIGWYWQNYYKNTLTRASPFIIGMIYGYILHMMNGRKVRNKAQGIALWVIATIVSAVVIYGHHPTNQLDRDNQIGDNLFNSFARSAWAVALGWMILACHSGFGGPLNWFLSLSFWKIPARMSYTMYVLHMTIIMSYNATDTAPVYFSVGELLFLFLADFSLTLIVSFLATILIDAPCSTLIKMAMGGGKKSTKKQNGTTNPPEIMKTNL